MEGVVRMFIILSPITGVMVGFEYFSDNTGNNIMLDLFILRIIFNWE
jgi:hypothetical protein